LPTVESRAKRDGKSGRESGGIDEMMADTDVKKDVGERESVERRNDAKDHLRDG
jgi:hypothetical protein